MRPAPRPLLAGPAGVLMLLPGARLDVQVPVEVAGVVVLREEIGEDRAAHIVERADDHLRPVRAVLGVPQVVRAAGAVDDRLPTAGVNDGERRRQRGGLLLRGYLV